MVETFTAEAVARGVDWQGWVQTALAVLVPVAAVFYVELVTVPRVQDRLGRAEAQRTEDMQRRLADEAAERAQHLDEASARRTVALHRQALDHSDRVARDARYGDALFALRRALRSTLAELIDLRARLAQRNVSRPDNEPRLIVLRAEIEALRNDAGDLMQSNVATALSAALSALPGGGTVRVLSDAEPHLREALRLATVNWIVWLGLTDQDVAKRMQQHERRLMDSP